ncbi:hypothetical protein ACOCEA_09390 [Maribacter sp. CXY002]|uniref:hypothetical protein n=1 Tax=Maribacter luteocoastalis TaxID=3407671 RepID=UPI003B6805FF
MKNNKYLLIGCFLLLIQIGQIIYSRFIPERFFCWAPYDEQTPYLIQVEVNSRMLSENEVSSRYGYGAKRVESRSIHNVFSIIEQYERTYGILDNAKVTVHYNINGKKDLIWTY